MNALKVENLFKKYKSDIYSIQNINFSVSENAFHVLIGENGAGKTTIIKSIVGAYKNFEGNIKIFNKSNLKSNYLKKISYIPEKTIFPKYINTYQYLSYIYSVCENTDIKRSKERAIVFMKKFNLLDFKDKNPNLLSSGQKKKVLLVQALMQKAKIIIMDEPTAALDPIARKDFFLLLRKIIKDGKTILIATHVIHEIQNLANEVTIVKNGQVQFTGKVNKKQDVFKLYKKYSDIKDEKYA